MKIIYEVVDRTGKVRAMYCMQSDAEQTILTEYKGCKIRELPISFTDQPKRKKK